MQGSDVLDDEPSSGAFGPADGTQVSAGTGRGGPETWNLDALPPELDYFRSSAAWQIELTGFQGPLDLLLYLLDKDQVDIYDIPIARITDQFIRHIEVMQSISLDQAGEFIAMAATLLVIKMKMLMPSRAEEEEEAEEDPRAELVRRLLEYKRFKEAALAFQEREDERARFHTRQLKFPFTSDLAVEPALRIEMFDLLAALAGIYDRVRKRPVHDIVREPFTVDEKIELIAARTTDGALVRFEELFADDTIKMEVVVTFIAILEMVKRGRLVFVQTEPLGPIWLQRPAPGATTGADPDIDESYAPEASSESVSAPTSVHRAGGDDGDDEDEGWSQDDLDDEDDEDDDDIDWDDDDLDDIDEDDDASDDVDAVKADDAGSKDVTAVVVDAKAGDDDDDEAQDDDEDDDDWDDDDDEDWDDDDDDDDDVDVSDDEDDDR
ncbi:MAG: segregation/condensation protein A [bacterium]|nr:segregation/condensation protein A [bacterium]